MTVAKKPVIPQIKPEPNKPKAPEPPPTRKNAKKSSVDKKQPPATLPAKSPEKPPAKLAAKSPAKSPEKPPAKPPAKLAATPQKEFHPRLKASSQENQAGAGSTPGRGVQGAADTRSMGSPSKESSAGSSAGSAPGGSDPGASGNSPVGILSKTRPAYPRSALQSGQEGWVKVSFTITEQGRIENPAVVSSRPRQVFDQAALEAIMQWRFRPKRVNGKPVSTTAIQEIKFTLSQ
jgi:protein TonB